MMTSIQSIGRNLLAALVVITLLSTTGCPLQRVGPYDGMAPSTVQRLPYASQCATFAGLCTSSFPVAVAEVVARDAHQSVTRQEDPLRFIVRGVVHDGGEVVQLRGSDSFAGNTATAVTYNWSINAVDDDPCSMTPGEVFSTEADPTVALQNGVHYVRLTVKNDLPLDPNTLPDSVIDQCGTLDQTVKYDYIEFIVEVSD